jgi:hypothetical protein
MSQVTAIAPGLGALDDAPALPRHGQAVATGAGGARGRRRTGQAAHRRRREPGRRGPGRAARAHWRPRTARARTSQANRNFQIRTH